MPLLSSNSMWETFGLRALSYVFYGGADLGECVSTVNRVGDGGADDWHREWLQTADRITAIANECKQEGHLVSAREAYFRAATYYHVSYFPLYGFPVDPRLTRAFEAEVSAFQNAALLTEPPIEPIEIPFEGASLPGYFVRGDGNAEVKPTIVHIDGYDGNIQEMYF